MSIRPRKGQSVAFTSELAQPAQVATESISGLRFTIRTQDGGEVLLDYTHLTPRWLALAFARALWRLADLGGRLSVRSTVRAYTRTLQWFFAYLEDTGDSPSSPQHLRMQHIDGFEAWLAVKGTSPIHLLTIVTKVIVVLREIAAEGAIVFSEELRDRLAYITLRPIPPSRPRDAYSPFIARQVRKAARTDIVRIFRRFREPTPLPMHPDLKVFEDEARASIEARGVLLHQDREYKRLLRARRVLGIFTGDLNAPLHERYYLTSKDVIPLLVFLALETGLEIECCKALTVDCLQNPANGTVEIAYVKRRAQGAEHKTLRVRDGGLLTPGGMIRHIVALTAAARRHQPIECLWLHYGLGRLKAQLKNLDYLVDQWTRRHGIRDDAGQIFHLELSRLRKTHKALWYLKTEGHMARFAVGHTREIAARHYADVPVLKPLHEATIAEAFHEAVLSAVSPIILTPEKEDEWRREPANASHALPAGSNPISLLDGEQDIWLASCGGFFSSPFADVGSPCALPFWGCLECPNAVITARKLPAILAFLDFVQDQRNVLSAAQWELKFATAYARITRQILPAFGPTMITEARNALEREQVSLYLPPEVSL